MFSSRGISWRHGPHQLAQKLSITTWPLYCARLILEPARESRVNCGAGPLPEAAFEAGTATSSAVATAVTIARVTLFAAIRPEIRLLIVRLRATHASHLKEYGRAEGRFHVVGELGHAQQVSAEHAILHLDVDREPVRGQHPVAAAEVHREVIVACELGAADATQKIEGARHGAAPTDEGLAREQVVAQGDVVVREASLIVRKQLNTAAEGLKARAAGI